MIRDDQVSLGHFPHSRDCGPRSEFFEHKPFVRWLYHRHVGDHEVDAPIEVSGNVQCLTILGCPLAVCVIATITRLAPEAKSMAPPIPGTIRPGTMHWQDVLPDRLCLKS